MSGARLRGSIYVVGSINVDTTFGVPRIPAPGETVLASRRAVASGGKGANQAVAAAALGSLVSFIGCVGADRDGAYALETLRARGVDVSNVDSRDDDPTGTAIVLVAPNGENVIVVDQGANGHVDPLRVEARLHAARPVVVLAQLETNLDAVLAAAMSSGSATFILNPAPTSMPSTALGEILAYTDVMVPNRTELAWLAGVDTPRTSSEVDDCVAALDFAGHVIVTLGGDGAVMYEAGREGRGVLIAPVTVDTIDTSGAGDAFCGALGHCLAAGDNLDSAVRRANEVAAWTTTLHGAQIPEGKTSGLLGADV